jgi:hypothetical protein
MQGMSKNIFNAKGWIKGSQIQETDERIYNLMGKTEGLPIPRDG